MLDAHNESSRAQKPRQIRTRDLAEMGLSGMQKMSQVLPKLAEAVIRAHRDSDGGISGAGGEAVSGTRVVDAATAERALGRLEHPDPVRLAATNLADALFMFDHAAALCLMHVHQLVALDPKKVAV